MINLLAWIARHGRFALIAGLLAGACLPDLAAAMRQGIAPIIVALLFLAVLRLGPAGLRAGASGLRRAMTLTLAAQLVLPLIAAGILGAAGILHHPLAMGTVLILAAAPITGSPSLALLARAEPAPALRQLVLGTALLPLTVLPVFAVMPAFGDASAVLFSAMRLLGVIALAGGTALVLRFWFPWGAGGNSAVDGLSAVLLGLVVIGLMSAIGPAFQHSPALLAGTLAVAMLLNLTLQLGASLLLARSDPAAAPAFGITTGNRNIALFLSILPAATVDQIILLVGCYQIPMYLTPVLLTGWYRRIARRA